MSYDGWPLDKRKNKLRERLMILPGMFIIENLILFIRTFTMAGSKANFFIITFKFKAIIICASPITVAAPPISFFIRDIDEFGLIFNPPVSKQTPFPTNAKGSFNELFFPSFRHLFGIKFRQMQCLGCNY